MDYIIRVAEKGTQNQWWTVLHPHGSRGATGDIRHATKMTLPEAWCVLRELGRDPTPQMTYSICKWEMEVSVR